jgi:TonB family protein
MRNSVGKRAIRRIFVAAHSPAILVVCAILAFCAATLSVSSARAQDGSAIPSAAQSQFDALASRIAEHMHDANLTPESRKIFVIDFSNASDRRFSRLGSLLADEFAKSISKAASGFEVEDRLAFAAYLKENWMAVDDLENQSICLALARSLGGAGIVLGTLDATADGQLRVSVRLEGVGPAWSDAAQFPLTDALQQLWKQPAPSFARSGQSIPAEPGIVRADDAGVTLPACVFCPSPDYTDLARAAKFRGTVELSLIVTKDGEVNSVVVLRGAPFSLTKQAVDAVQKWKFKPGKKNKQSVSVRVPVDIEFQLY